jgi:hypothetical protein
VCGICTLNTGRSFIVSSSLSYRKQRPNVNLIDLGTFFDKTDKSSGCKRQVVKSIYLNDGSNREESQTLLIILERTRSVFKFLQCRNIGSIKWLIFKVLACLVNKKRRGSSCRRHHKMFTAPPLSPIRSQSLADIFVTYKWKITTILILISVIALLLALVRVARRGNCKLSVQNMNNHSCSKLLQQMYVKKDTLLTGY